MYSCAYFHAAISLLQKISQVQQSFLHKLEVSEEDAFLKYNFAPTDLRRNIAVLGMIHKRLIGESHPTFEALLPRYADHFNTPRAIGHNKQLYGHWLEATAHRALFARSVFALIDIYNNLPQYVVDAKNVGHFQKMLADMTRKRCESAHADWAKRFL